MPCSHEATAPSGLEGEALEVAVAAASARCDRAGERLTTARARVLSLLLESSTPRKAYDLIANFGEPRDPPKPATIYRALEFLVRLGIAHRIESTNSYLPCRKSGAAHPAGFLICTCCGRAEEVQADMAPSNAAAEAAGYMLATIVLEVVGTCRACGPTLSKT